MMAPLSLRAILVPPRPVEIGPMPSRMSPSATAKLARIDTIPPASAAMRTDFIRPAAPCERMAGCRTENDFRDCPIPGHPGLSSTLQSPNFTYAQRPEPGLPFRGKPLPRHDLGLRVTVRFP